jgi:hypothetical protein
MSWCAVLTSMLIGLGDAADELGGLETSWAKEDTRLTVPADDICAPDLLRIDFDPPRAAGGTEPAVAGMAVQGRRVDVSERPFNARSGSALAQQLNATGMCIGALEHLDYARRHPEKFSVDTLDGKTVHSWNESVRGQPRFTDCLTGKSWKWKSALHAQSQTTTESARHGSCNGTVTFRLGEKFDPQCAHCTKLADTLRKGADRAGKLQQ